VKLAGGLYLLYLVVEHFRGRAEAGGTHPPDPPKRWFGLSAFWSTVVRVELMNLAFSIDSILVAVAMSSKFWVVLSGGLIGIVAMRVVVGWVIRLIKHYPALVHGAFIIIGWVAVKLILDWAHQSGYVAWEVPQLVSLGLIGVMLAASYFYARAHAAREAAEE
jgi:YkoY family integral membrane protein